MSLDLISEGSFSSEQKAAYLNAIQSILNYKDTWRFYSNLTPALVSLERINQLSYTLKCSSGFEFISKKTRLVQLIVDLLNSSYEYVKNNVVKHNLIIPRDHLYDRENKYPG